MSKENVEDKESYTSSFVFLIIVILIITSVILLRNETQYDSSGNKIIVEPSYYITDVLDCHTVDHSRFCYVELDNKKKRFIDANLFKVDRINVGDKIHKKTKEHKESNTLIFYDCLNDYCKNTGFKRL